MAAARGQDAQFIDMIAVATRFQLPGAMLANKVTEGCMTCMTEKSESVGLKYATSYEEKLLGRGCDVEVTVDVETGAATAIVAMRELLRHIPAFRISVEDLAAIASIVKTTHARARLLDDLIDGAKTHQLNYSRGGATLIVVHPKGKAARFVLTIGSFNREGDLDKLSDHEISSTVRRVEELKDKTRAKVVAFIA